MEEVAACGGCEEALAWLNAVCRHGKATPRNSLFSYFRGQTKQSDLTLAVVNLISACCKAVFPSSESPGLGLDCQAAATYLYYMVAEDTLQVLFPRNPPSARTAAAAQRFKGMLPADNPPGCAELVACVEFHLPFIECALHLVHHVTAPEGTPPSSRVTELLQRRDRAPLLWQAASTFLECFGPTSQHALPPVLQAFLTDLQAQLLDGPVLATGSVFFQLVAPPAGHSAAPLGDSSLPERLVAAYAGQVIQHAQLVAWHLQQQQQQQQQEEAAAATPELLLPADFATQCAWLVDCVVLHHLGLCFGVPACAVVACGVYLAAKVLRPGAISFAALTQAMSACLPPHRLGLTGDIEVALNPEPRRGDVRAYYNDRFLPAVRPRVYVYLQEYEAHVTRQALAPARRLSLAAAPPAAQPLAPALALSRKQPLQVLTANAAAGGRPPLGPKAVAGRRISISQPGGGGKENQSSMGGGPRQQPAQGGVGAGGSPWLYGAAAPAAKRGGASVHHYR